jgi:hypothetical protein
MHTVLIDNCALGEKATHILFWEDPTLTSTIFALVYPSLGIALDSLMDSLQLAQSIHDTSGHLIAYTHNGKVVMCSA